MNFAEALFWIVLFLFLMCVFGPPDDPDKWRNP